jgi:hypothetical protein
VQKAALVETHNSQQQQQWQQQELHKQPAASQSIHQILNPSPASSFSESFIYSGKQGGGARVLWEGHDIVPRETRHPTSPNVNNLGKASVLHFAFTTFCSWGHAKLSLPFI